MVTRAFYATFFVFLAKFSKELRKAVVNFFHPIAEIALGVEGVCPSTNSNDFSVLFTHKWTEGDLGGSASHIQTAVCSDLKNKKELVHCTYCYRRGFEDLTSVVSLLRLANRWQYQRLFNFVFTKASRKTCYSIYRQWYKHYINRLNKIPNYLTLMIWETGKSIFLGKLTCDLQRELTFRGGLGSTYRPPKRWISRLWRIKKVTATCFSILSINTPVMCTKSWLTWPDMAQGWSLHMKKIQKHPHWISRWISWNPKYMHQNSALVLTWIRSDQSILMKELQISLNSTMLCKCQI